MTELARGRGLAGRVVSFDAAVGLGEIESSTGERHLFHCIEIADGTRDIAVDVEVNFDLLNKFGRAEAANIRA
jgi:cold shock CspA family protein